MTKRVGTSRMLGSNKTVAQVDMTWGTGPCRASEEMQVERRCTHASQTLPPMPLGLNVIFYARSENRTHRQSRWREVVIVR